MALLSWQKQSSIADWSYIQWNRDLMLTYDSGSLDGSCAETLTRDLNCLFQRVRLFSCIWNHSE
jgi:hypothetical protein